MELNLDLDGLNPKNAAAHASRAHIGYGKKTAVSVCTRQATRHRYDFSTPPNRVSHTTSFNLIVSRGSGCESHAGGRKSRLECGRSWLYQCWNSRLTTLRCHSDTTKNLSRQSTCWVWMNRSTCARRFGDCGVFLTTSALIDLNTSSNATVYFASLSRNTY
jgi:hypothetical protein